MNDEVVVCSVDGHCLITELEDDGSELIVLDQHNAVHPQNLARCWSRALANEPNSYIYRMAFGNGGTVVDPALTVTYNKPNDGQSPDTAGWQSRLYHETYSEIIDDGLTVLNPDLGKDPGSADVNTGVRVGGGDVASDDPPSVVHTSGPGVRSAELGVVSRVQIVCVLNPSEPLAQSSTDYQYPTGQTEGDFVFDEIGLYSGGASAIPTSGYQQIYLNSKKSTDITGLAAGTTYALDVNVNGTASVVRFTVPTTGGSGASGTVTYGDLCEAINNNKTTWGLSGIARIDFVMQISDSTSSYASIAGAQTFGYLVIKSAAVGSTSSIDLTGTNTSAFLAALTVSPAASLVTAVAGTEAGLQNSPTTPTLERERLLTHLTFSPILKASNRRLTIKYTLTLSVSRTPSMVS